MNRSAGSILPHMDRAVYKLTEVIEHAFANDMVKMSSEREPLLNSQPVYLDAAAAEYRDALTYSFRYDMGRFFKTVFPWRTHPIEPFVGTGRPQIITLLHISPEPVQHLCADSGQKVLTLCSKHISPVDKLCGKLQLGNRRIRSVERSVRQSGNIDIVCKRHISLPGVGNILHGLPPDFSSFIPLTKLYFSF